MKKKSLPCYLALAFLLAGCGANNASETPVVTVDPTVTKIEFGEGEIKTNYHFGESFTRPTVLATYSDGTKEDVTAYLTVSGFNSRKLGNQTVVLSYDAYELTYSVTVVNEIKEIQLSGQTKAFEVGDEFSFGGAVFAVYDNESVVDVTSESSFSGFDSSSVGECEITVSYQNFTTSYVVTIKAKSAKTVSSLQVNDPQTEYVVGDTFVRPVVNAVYTDESSEDVSDLAVFSGYVLTQAGTYTVTVSYGGVSTSYEITVKEDEGNIDDIDDGDDTIFGSFKITTKDGVAPTVEDNIYTISAAGSYKISGKLDNGQIVVNAPEAEVELSFEEASISSDFDSPIRVVTADSVDIKVKKNTSNYIYDNRVLSSSDTDPEGAGIYVEDGDLKIKGTGKLVVKSTYNNGIHGKDDVTIKNAVVLVRAINNGIKGNDSVTIEETPTIDVICGNDGIKTSNTDVSSKGNRRGNVSITGGNIQINSYADGIDAAYDAIISNGIKENDDGTTEETSPVIDIYTNKYSSYSESALEINSLVSRATKQKAADSAKGIKACNLLTIDGGTIYTKTYDDGLHGNKTSDNVQIVFEDGTYATGNVTISGGSYTGYASDDGIHADGTLTISGGEIKIEGAYEGVEGNVINVTGGNTAVVASDDGVNAQSSINISGGLLDVTVSPSGDTDGIDSNGTITVTGGVIITRGPNSNNMSPLDADGTIALNGGTVIIVGRDMTSSGGGGGGWWLNPNEKPGGPGGGGGGMPGEGTISVGSNMTTTAIKNAGLSKGSYTVSFTNSTSTISYTNIYTYSGAVTVYSVNGTATIK